MVGGNVGGIPLQVIDGKTGFLVDTIEQAAQIIHEYILKDNTGLQNTIDTAYDLLDRNSV